MNFALFVFQGGVKRDPSKEFRLVNIGWAALHFQCCRCLHVGDTNGTDWSQIDISQGVHADSVYELSKTEYFGLHWLWSSICD